MATCQVCEIHAESVFKIEGMDCHEEVAILEKRLKKLAGLEALDADVLSQRLTIKYDAAKLNTSTIAEAVAQTGMRAWLEHEQPTGVAPSAATRRVYVATSGRTHRGRAGARVPEGGSPPGGRDLRRGDRERRDLQRAPRAARGAVAGARHQRPHARRGLPARWCWGSGAKGRASSSCSRSRSCSRRARWSARAAPSARSWI